MNEIPREVSDAVPGFVGSLVALTFLSGSWKMRLTMVAGGSALSYYATPPINAWFHVPNAQGLIGFAIGLFGMAIISKLHEMIQAIKATDLAQSVTDRLRKMIGGGNPS